MRRLLRASEWWHSKPPVMLGIAYYQLSLASPAVGFGRALVTLALFLVAIIGIGGFGHVVNDFFDQELDERVGDSNALASLRRAQLVGLIALLLVAALLPWVWLPTSAWIIGLLALEFVLFIAYSAPPVRLKCRGLLGVVADALYGYTIPVIVALLVFGRLGHVHSSALVAILAVWTLALGCRWILTHQLEELLRDQGAGVGTFAVRRGWRATLSLLSTRLLPLEGGLFVLVIAWLGRHAVLVPVGFVIWVLSIRMEWRPFSLARPATREASRMIRRLIVFNVEVMNRFQTQWLPVLLLVTLVFKAPAFAALLALHLLCFESGPATLVRQDLPVLRASIGTPRLASR